VRFGDVFGGDDNRLMVIAKDSERFPDSQMCVALGPDSWYPPGKVSEWTIIKYAYWEKIECETVESILGRPLPGSTASR